MNTLISWLHSSIIYGTVIMFGALGETLTEKSGHLNLGVPGLMYLGGFAGFASAFIYERSTDNPNAVLLILIPLLCAFLAAMLGGLLYSFMTVTLRANQNVTGLALTSLGVGIGTFGSARLLSVTGSQSYSVASATSAVYTANLNSVTNLGAFGQIFLSYGFLTYAAIILAVLMNYFLMHTRRGLNLRAVGENPGTADAAGINVTLYKYIATSVGGGICGIGGFYYIIEYSSGKWSSQNSLEAVGWLAVALVIFSTWKPKNTIWASYLFALLFWMATNLPALTGIRIPTSVTELLKMTPYVVTILVLVIASTRKKKENQGPASLGLSYFREER